tara:strand:- start:898 stop:1098 length:201 start_codon:yes stop_codon:yes gene_type:complete
LINWNKLKIHPSKDMTDVDVKDFVEWVSKKAERLGFNVELKIHQEKESSSSDVMSVNPLSENNETH